MQRTFVRPQLIKHGHKQGRIQWANRAMAPIQFCHGLSHSSEGKNIFIPNFPNFCDYFVKKVVSEIRKCCQLQRDKVP